MAFLEEADEDFKLPLRPWLEKQINSGKYLGLEWEPCSDDSKQFRLPWVKKNLPNWQDYYRIFRAWAEHRGRGEVEKLDDSKLKSNFRCALNKSVDFEEISSKSQLQKQTGNYKVYRILSPREVREKKKKRSRIQTKQEPLFDHNFDSDDFKTLDTKDLDFAGSIDGHSSKSGSLGSPDISMSMPNGLYTGDMMIDHMLPNGDMSYTQLAVQPPVEMEDLNLMLAISPADHSAQTQHWTNDVTMEETDPAPSVSTKADPADAESDYASQAALILQQYVECGIRSDKIKECQVIISYNGVKMYDEHLSNMDKGYRIFYGNQSDQIRLLQIRNCTDEKMADFKLRGISLPPIKQQSHTMSAILDKTELGIVLRYDPQNLTFTAKRLCQSQVFCSNPHEHNPLAIPMKMERGDVVTLFSLEKYFIDFLHSALNESFCPQPEILLAVGIKPKNKQAMHSMKGLKIELIPYALKFMQNTNSTSSLSLCFSNPTSMENLLRQISTTQGHLSFHPNART
ncbi:interferon regulatory factor 4-like [Styela clava]